MTSTTQSNPSSSMTTPLLHHIETTHYSPSSSSSTTSTNFRLPELHQLRNKVIGNPSEKKKLLANLASLTSLAECITQVSFVYLPPSSSLFTLWPLSNVNDSLVLQQGLQAMVIFGSLAMWSDPCTRVLSDLDVVSSLLACLNGPPWVPLLEASTRALKAFAYNPHVSKTELLQEPSLLTLLALLTRTVEIAPKVATACAFILAKACDYPGIQTFLALHQPIPLFMKLWAHPMTLEAGLRVVTAFCQEDPRNGQRVLEAETINHRPILSELLSYTRDKRPLVRLHAATCLTHLFRSKLFSALPDPIHFHLMPCLIKLFDAPYPINEQACLVFASLVQDSEDMQQLASDMDTIPKLADLVRPSSSSTPPPFSSSSHPKSVFLKPSPTSTSTSTSTSSTSTSSSSTSSLSSKETSLSEAVLLAMAGVSSLHEPSRKLFCQHPWLTSWTVQNLTHPSLHVRAAACQCLRSISRSVKHLRSTLLDAGLVDPLFQLFHEETHPTVLIPASAVLCNLVLDFAPMKHLFIEKGGIERLAQWTVTSTDLQLRMNSVWAFKNLAYNAVLSTKQKLMETLGFQPLKNLLNDPDVGLQEQAFNLLRNLVCGAEEDVDYICQGLGSNELMELMAMTFIKPRKDPSHPTPTPTQIQEKEKEKEKELNEHFHPTTTNTNTTTSDILHQALCVIVNVAAGGEKHKQMIMQHDGLLKSIFGFMKDPHASIRVASVWIVINLTWPEDPHSTNRIVQLRELGFEHVLQHLKKDSDVDVRDRVKAALLQFNDAT